MAARASTSGIPQEPGLDQALTLLSEGYRFIGNRCERCRTDIFETRLMMRLAICVAGEEAARRFYVLDRFTRQGVIPVTAPGLLQDVGSVATLDNEIHHSRKRMFMSLMTPVSMQRL